MQHGRMRDDRRNEPMPGWRAAVVALWLAVGALVAWRRGGGTDRRTASIDLGGRPRATAPLDGSGSFARVARRGKLARVRRPIARIRRRPPLDLLHVPLGHV